MASGSVIVPPGEAAMPLNFIYACSVCCYTFADVYEGHNKTVEGFSDGINPKERLVTHLYLASCCHVFCGSHLEGGAPPFHPEGQRPKAPCPTCVREKKDSEPRDLYSIRGFHRNEHDPMIPPAWFDAPPINFNGNEKDIEALRVLVASRRSVLDANILQFQYLALVRYCQNVHATRKPLQDALAQAEQKLTSIQDLTSKEHAKVLTLQQENQILEDIKQKYESAKVELERLHAVEREVEQYRRLDVNPKDLETFKNNKDAIRHYLKLVPTLIEQNDKMRKRLASLGFAMALEPVPNLKGFDLNALNDDGGINCDYFDTSETSLPNTTSSQTAGRSAGRSAQTHGNAIAASSSPFIQRPLKRQRVDSPLPNNTQVEPPTSRDAMPPPQKPVSRMRSVRKMFPTLKKKFTGAHFSKASAYDFRGVNDVHMYEDGPWDSTVSVSATNGPTFMQHEAVREDTQYMSGALPAESPQHGANQRGSQLFSSVGAENDEANFTFRSSSPVKMDNATGSHRPVQLPSEPSYIRLMDGLSRDNGVELGLKDPRDYAPSSFDQFHSSGRDTPYLQDPRSNIELGARDERYQGSLYRYQSPHELPHFRTNDSNSTHATHTNHMDGTYQDILRSPLTPAPKLLNRPGRQIDIFKSFRRLSVSKASDDHA
ncbi:hypothetical protein BDU57DRAFT_463919 [Ampelomyces quisqualis]|uniref:Uncharacterized protein n=1 Tax=Ampelomyces quisqualis TaxID=50730 RepID=A0A6A5R2K4_AMPQU|nr:hypothetical protein BDU57DRAFT_463919 [Ampelomyces quisqualis]